jgi:hypothetical protein
LENSGDHKSEKPGMIPEQNWMLGKENASYQNISPEYVSSTTLNFSVQHRWKTGDKMACYDFKLITSFNCSHSATGIIQYPMIREDHHIYQHEALEKGGHDLVLCIHL